MTAVGLNLHVQFTISDTPISEVIRGILPFLTGLLIVPGMTLWPPHHVYGQSYWTWIIVDLTRRYVPHRVSQ